MTFDQFVAAPFELGIELGEALAVGSARKRVGPFHLAALEAGQPFERVERPVVDLPNSPSFGTSMPA